MSLVSSQTDIETDSEFFLLEVTPRLGCQEDLGLSPGLTPLWDSGERRSIVARAWVIRVTQPLRARELLPRRIHLSSEHTYQVNSLIGLDLKLRKRALEDPLGAP